MSEFSNEEKDHILLMQIITQKIQEYKPFVLKGGTALMIAYGLDRFSEDLDFDVYSSYRGSHAANLISVLQSIKYKKFHINEVVIKKNTNTVNRYIINYQNSMGNQASLKIEISYRTPLHKDEAILKNGVYVSPIEKISEFKINSILDLNNDSRTKARDLYDANFIVRNYPNAVSDKQIIDLINLNINHLEMRYMDSFKEDKILSKNKDLSVIILELVETSGKIAQDRKIEKHNLNSTIKTIDLLKQQLTQAAITKNHPTISSNDAKAIALFANHQLDKYKNPSAQQSILEKIHSQLPDIASGKITLPALPELNKKFQGR